MPTNVVEFNKALRKWAEDQVPQDFAVFHRRVALEAFTRFVQKTPADTGEHRGKWNIGINVEGDDTQTPDRDGSATVARGAAKIQKAPPFSVINATNHGRAIRILNDGGFVPPDPGPSRDPREGRKGRILVSGGYSVQAPRGIVDITFQELIALFGP